MIDVVCFCGSSYSFVGDAGACPQCGEHVSFARRPTPEAHTTRDELGQLLKLTEDQMPPDEMAA
jgi:hypothetical protein